MIHVSKKVYIRVFSDYYNEILKLVRLYRCWIYTYVQLPFRNSVHVFSESIFRFLTCSLRATKPEDRHLYYVKVVMADCLLELHRIARINSTFRLDATSSASMRFIHIWTTFISLSAEILLFKHSLKKTVGNSMQNTAAVVAIFWNSRCQQNVSVATKATPSKVAEDRCAGNKAACLPVRHTAYYYCNDLFSVVDIYCSRMGNFNIWQERNHIPHLASRLTDSGLCHVDLSFHYALLLK